ncbi:formyltetrahydrofolate deformylase [Arthrobacter sp. Hiyo6]|nr:formyltetrahydrofolate deformylase [Arthrobacter sp. Hiyo6]
MTPEPTSEVRARTVGHILTLDCAETPGIVHAVTGFLLENGCDIVDNKQYGERSEGHFFMRVHFESEGDAGTAGNLREAFAPVAADFGMTWRLEPHGSRRRVLIMVSKFGHCLNDLLFRARIGELPVDVVAVVSNHADHQHSWNGMASRSSTSLLPPGPSRPRRPGCWNSWTNSTSSSWCWPATCRFSATD